MPESVTGSNWDFTPVINLLHSHAYGSDGAASGSPYHATKDGALSSYSSEELEPIGDFSDSCVSEPTDANNHQTTTPKLGDFGSLWDLLSQSSGAATSVSARDDQDSDATPRALSPSVPNVKILKRPSDKPLGSTSVTQVPPRTPPRSIPGPSSKSRYTKGKSTAVLVRNAQTGVKGYEASSSDNAEGESDGNVSIFDPPLSTKPGALSSPSRLDSHKNNLDDSPPSSFDELVGGFFTPETTKKSSGNGAARQQPSSYKSIKQKRAGLLAKLAQDFPDCVGALTQTKQSLGPDAGNPMQPIHVFVDMSNIMVGFHDSYKLARNIPVETRIRRLPLSFQNFSLILERGRPSTKRVLVGSDRFAAIDEGEKLGYEKNILDRVHKAKQLTQRQARYQAASSSETNEAAVERWVEQGVDEILHLKILESLVDTDEPATIVLATGDAAEAEYSGGFMKMVERALQRGWTVELVSFTQVTSQAYQRKKFRAKWGDRFKMIALERYIEELLA